jgi:hypothetical protein
MTFIHKVQILKSMTEGVQCLYALQLAIHKGIALLC